MRCSKQTNRTSSISYAACNSVCRKAAKCEALSAYLRKNRHTMTSRSTPKMLRPCQEEANCVNRSSQEDGGCSPGAGGGDGGVGTTVTGDLAESMTCTLPRNLSGIRSS